MNTPPNLGIWLFFADLALFLAVTTAIVYAWREVRYRPIAAWLSVVMVGDWICRGLNAGPLSMPGPYTGSTRLAFHVTEALWLVWPAGLALASLLCLAPREPDPTDARRRRAVSFVIGAVYLALVAVLVVGYPTIRGPLVRQVYLGAELAAVAVLLVSAAAWFRRGPFLTVGVVVIAALFANELALLFTHPWREPLPDAWVYAWPVHVVIYAAIAAVQGGGTWVRNRS